MGDIFDFTRERFLRVDRRLDDLSAQVRSLSGHSVTLDRSVADIRTTLADLRGDVLHLGDRLDRIVSLLETVKP